ncbi:MAG: hypothetical protein Q4F05_09305 [bacterium]|nr:hypothetical protein [bacterium]
MNRDLLLLIHLMKSHQNELKQTAAVNTIEHTNYYYNVSNTFTLKQSIANVLRGIANQLDATQQVPSR